MILMINNRRMKTKRRKKNLNSTYYLLNIFLSFKMILCTILSLMIIILKSRINNTKIAKNIHMLIFYILLFKRHEHLEVEMSTIDHLKEEKGKAKQRGKIINNIFS